MIERAKGRRLTLYLLSAFAISWTAWGGLATFARPTGPVLAHPLSAVLFVIGGVGPAIAAPVAVALTQTQGTLGEYAGRLFRWRVNPLWWLAALAVPPAVNWLVERVVLLTTGPAQHAAPLEPLSRLAVLFPMMIIGGGLEELGWRGVAQPELERRLNRVGATVIVGAVWALWHLPLFYIPGVGQYGSNFGFFALQVMGTAFITAWLYAGTRSILLCVMFHAAFNTASAMGLEPPDGPAGATLLGGAVRLAIGVALVLSLRRSRPVAQPITDS